MTTPAAKRLRLTNFLRPDQHFHLARCDYPAGRAVSPHRHDFTELFWVIDGAGTHVVNQTPQRLTTGTLVLMRPDDVHGLAARANERFAIFNLAFANEPARFIHERYFGGGDWPWAGGTLPASFTLDAVALERLNHEAHRLARAAQGRLPLESFLLNLLQMLSEQAPPAGDDRPTWLTHAIQRMDDGPALRRGVAALAQHAGRSTEHLNRVVRQRFGCTTTDLVNDLRLTRAARLLRVTDRPIPAVAYDAGYENLGYFYRRFKQRYRRTPRAYRRHAQAVAR